MPDLEDDPFNLRSKTRREVEMSTLAENAPFNLRGAAQAELIRRDREYSEERERDRRKFETALVEQQLSAAISVAKATKWAVIAAIAAAIGALVQAAAAIFPLIHALQAANR